MYRQALFLSILLVVPCIGSAQVLIQPTSPPLVTAENESWYLQGDPITFAGNHYYPGGAQVFFNPNEMVRSGSYLGIPLYARTTIEPYSVVYVPVAGGLMQPYERLRTGALVGTAGSQPAALTSPYDPRLTGIPQAPGAPAFGPVFLQPPPVLIEVLTVDRERGAVSTETKPSVGTTGTRSMPPQHTRIGERPKGINAIFVDYDGRRWYSSGKLVEVDPTRLLRIEDYKGFGVWRDAARAEIIYLATTRDGMLAVEYSLTRPQIEGLEGGRRIP